MNTPTNNHCYHFGTNVKRICIDTGASASLSPNKHDFIQLQPASNLKINGIASGLSVEGIGMLKWPTRDDNGHAIDLYIHNALYVPHTPMALLCPQQLAQQTQLSGDGFNALSKHGIFTFAGHKRTIPYDTTSRLPILYSIDGIQCYLTHIQNSEQLKTQENLSRQQRLLLNWHYRLSRLHFAKIQDLAQHGILPKHISSCPHPICCSCQLGKAHLRSSPNINDVRHIDHDDLQPGDKVSVDQIESSTPGLVAISRGKPTNATYHVASVYVDHASSYTFVKMHYSTGGTKAVEGHVALNNLLSLMA